VNFQASSFEDFRNDGHTALTACCGCGGGQYPTSTRTSSTTIAPIGPCTDDPEGWRDSDGDTCEQYVSNKWCTPDGQKGVNFQASSFEDFRNDGHTALTACCGCGGGARRATGAFDISFAAIALTSTVQCHDQPTGWVDRWGLGCADYDAFQCFAAGDADDANLGSTAEAACCACGGGVGGERAKSAPEVVGVASEVGSCVDEPAGWQDSEGVGCEEYVGNDWCAQEGRFGENFTGDLDSRANGGRTAMTACCGCGGGRLANSPQRRAHPAELHLVHVDRVTGEQVVLVITFEADGAGVGAVMRLVAVDGGLDVLVSAAGGWAAARPDRIDALPPCGHGAARVHRLVTARSVGVLQEKLAAAVMKRRPRKMRQKIAAGDPHQKIAAAAAEAQASSTVGVAKFLGRK